MLWGATSLSSVAAAIAPASFDFVSGEKIGTREPTDMCIARWDSATLKKGENIIQVTAGDEKDSCAWAVQKQK